MLHHFPPGSTAVAVEDYDAPYPDPIAVRAGDTVIPDHERTRETDFMGWTWCRGPHGREGWTPNAWIHRTQHARTMRRDFDARELSARRGDRFTLILSESGFILVTNAATNQTGWLPDAVLQAER